MSKSNIGDLAIGAFCFASVCIGFICSRPKLAFYLSVCLALVVCAALFYVKIYIEMLGLFHTLPFAIVPWFISRFRQRRKSNGAVPLKGE
jgi:hypothetical protein